MLRTTSSVAAVIVTLGALAAAPAAARAASWVGLGDSYAAGPLIPNQSLSPLGCLRSDHNFAHLSAAAVGKTLADASCSGATTANMTASQSTSVGTNPPQFNALSAATTTVSLQIGGNDIGFTEVLENCVTYNPFSHPCQDKYNPGGNDQLAARIATAAPKVAAAIQGIHQADVAPNGTRIAFVGSAKASGGFSVFTSNLDGSALAKLVAPPAHGYLNGPAWSPDGTRVVAVQTGGRDGRAGASLVVFDAATGAATPIVKVAHGLLYAPSRQPLK